MTPTDYVKMLIDNMDLAQLVDIIKHINRRLDELDEIA